MHKEMKDSEIEWIGDVPNNWEIIKISSLFDLIGSGSTPTSTDESYYSSDICWIQSGDINGEFIEGTKKKVSINALKDFSALKMYTHDFIVIAMYGASIANISISKIDACVNQACCVLSKTNHNVEFVFYCIKSAKEYLIKFAVGGTQPNINQGTIRQLRLPVPSIVEQQKISSFLDSAVSQINSIIGMTKETIEDYKKYKQVLISEAVTMGINPEVELKESGIEWIGKIPCSWNRTKVKHLLAIPITDGPHETPELLEFGIPFISAEAIKNGKVNFNLKRGYISEKDCKKFNLKCKPELHDVFMIKSGATTGNVAIVETEEEFSIWSPLALFRCDASILNYKYLFFYLQSSVFQMQVQQFWNYGTQQNIGMGVLGNLYIAFPSVESQIEIADFIEANVTEIDSLVKQKQKLIEDLESYKKSLIYECVTGKREVS